MAEAKIRELRSDIDELNALMKQAQRKKVQDLLSSEIKKLENEWTNLNELNKAAAAGNGDAPVAASSIELDEAAAADSGDPLVAASSSSAQNKRYQIKLNGYGWDQSDKYVKVFVTLKDAHMVPKEQVYCKLSERSMELHVINLDSKDYLLVINKLLDAIDVDESHWKQKTDMIVVFLAKSRPNVKWSHMTEIEKKFEDQRLNRFKTDDVDKKDPQDSIMSLMKNMYETGDDEMKRMITKAWHDGQQQKRRDIVDL